MMWKAEGWLMGYNGGPIRDPTRRVYDRDIATLRRGLQLAGVTPTDDPDESFFVGRFPAWRPTIGELHESCPTCLR